jgi:hypothetical protein
VSWVDWWLLHYHNKGNRLRHDEIREEGFVAEIGEMRIG